MLFAGTSCKKDTDKDVELISLDPGVNFGDLGKVSFTYRGKQVTYKSVRAKDGNIWSLQDMGSSQVATQMKDTLAYGDFFQWGRWDDGHQVRRPEPTLSAQDLTVNNPDGIKNPVNPLVFTGWWSSGDSNSQWSAKNPSEVSATKGCDPCRAMGDGWRLPVITEWQELVRIEGISNSETAFNSTLKIPAGGWRSYISKLIINNAGADSWYWTSSASGNRGLGIWIRPGDILNNYPDVRAWGTSIRCIKK